MKLELGARGRFGFVRKGHFIAMPLCFPRVSEPIPPEASRIRALSAPLHGFVFGCTAGSAPHVFAAAVKPPGGYVVDLGVVDAFTDPAAVFVAGQSRKERRIVVAGNGGSGAALVHMPIAGFGNGVQEWAFRRPEMETLVALPGERMRSAALLASGDKLLCATESRILTIDLAGGSIASACDLPSSASDVQALLLVCDRCFAGTRSGELLSVEQDPLRLRPVEGDGAGFASVDVWTTDPCGRILAAGADGRLQGWRPDDAAWTDFGETPFAPVQCLAGLTDGRIFGLCGEGIGRFFAAGGEAEAPQDLGAVLAVHGAKRYGHTFSVAVTGDDGEIYLGEDDRGGHLWIYCPPYP